MRMRKACFRNCWMYLLDLAERKKEKVPSFAGKLENVTGIEGSDLVLSGFMSAYPRPKVMWVRNGVELAASDRYIMTMDDTKCSLKITGLTAADAGKYCCRIENKLGRAECDATVTVATVPKLLNELTNMEGKVGARIEFVAKIAASPKPDVQWYYQSHLLAVSTVC